MRIDKFFAHEASKTERKAHDDEYCFFVEAQIKESSLPETISGIARLLYSKLSNRSDAFMPNTELLFNKKWVTTERGKIPILLGDTPKKAFACHIYWKKQKNYLFKIEFVLPEQSSISQEYLNYVADSLSSAKKILPEYLENSGIRARLTYPLKDPFS